MLEVLYNKHNNSISLTLKASTLNDPILRAKDLTSFVTRMIISNKNKTLDSQIDSSIWDWDTLGASGIVTIYAGLKLLPSDKQTLWRLHVYDSTNPEGIVWGEFEIKVEKTWLV
jgi:hypothetical protein